MAATRRVTTCPACSVRGPAGARWCGHCGAPAALAPVGHLVVDDEAGPGQQHPGDGAGPAGPRWRWVAVAVALAVGASWLLPGRAATTTLVGRLDVATGSSSTVPPVTDLQLLWRRVVDPVQTTGGTAPLARPLGEAVLLDGAVVGAHRTTDVGVPDLWPGPDGRLVVADGEEVVVADADGLVRTRSRLVGAWRPVGGALGWVAGAAVLADHEGRLGAVGDDGTVRWVGEAEWTWDGGGHGSDWLVVGEPSGRWVVVDGRTGDEVGDGGPVDRVHAPVVHDATLVWVDTADDPVPGVGHPVVVRGRALDGSGRRWVADGLQPTSGVPTSISLTPVADGVAVAYWSAGVGTTAVWLRADDGDEIARTTVGGSGATPDGWPVAAVVGDAIAHIDPVREELRVVSRSSQVRWAVPAGAGEGLVTAGDTVVVHTPATTFTSQTRVRGLDAASGEVRWLRITDSTVDQHVVGVLRGHVGVAAATGGPVPLRDQAWFDPDSGRRRSALRLASAALGSRFEADSDLTLLGGVAHARRVAPLFLLPDGAGGGQLLGPADGVVLPGRLDPAPAAGTTMDDVTVADDDLAVRVGAAAVTARTATGGELVWRHDSRVVLRPDRSVLLPDAVVVAGVDGRLVALDRTDGGVRWTGPDLAVTAVTGAGDRVVAGTARGQVVVLGPDGDVEQVRDVGTGRVEDIAVVDRRVLATVGRDLVALGRGEAVVEPVDRVEVP